MTANSKRRRSTPRAGLDLRSGLENLTVSRTDSLSSPGDLGDAPDLRVLGLRDLPALADLGLLSGLTALTTVGIRGCPVLTDISASCPPRRSPDCRSTNFRVHLG
ncbi:hypothetical protein ACFWEB_02360 [Streptomyces parvus]|uniref:hypothetical protein n=1 Tax=Streptomyces parvus TaxID=66428 RepID=UPI00365F3036